AHEVMAEIFNNFDRQTETRFMTSLEDENRESAERIKALMFTFDDLIRLDTGSAPTLIRHIDKERLREVDEAQSQLVNLAKDLAAKGEIMISKGRNDEELIY